MATTSCDRASGEAVISDMKYDNDRAGETQDLRMGTMTPLDFRTRSDERASGRLPARLKLFQQNCSKGETLQIATSWVYIVKELCDFDKTIANIGNETLCVMK
jgi:hypothetical protein